MKTKQPTIDEFLKGTPLLYPSSKKGKTCIATLQDPTTVAVQDHKGVVGFATIPDGTARALYHNLTRSNP